MKLFLDAQYVHAFELVNPVNQIFRNQLVSQNQVIPSDQRKIAWHQAVIGALEEIFPDHVWGNDPDALMNTPEILSEENRAYKAIDHAVENSITAGQMTYVFLSKNAKLWAEFRLIRMSKTAKFLSRY
jgi:hypothetical protein